MRMSLRTVPDAANVGDGVQDVERKFNYNLLSNDDEAQSEGIDFFSRVWPMIETEWKPEKKPMLDKSTVIAAGVGSSSTQVYTMGDGNGVRAFPDSFLGALPTVQQKNDLASHPSSVNE